MASLGSIFVDLIARTAGYEAGFKKAQKTTSDFEKGVRNLLGQLAPLIGGAGFAAVANSALNAAEKINDASKAVGLSAESYQKLSFAFKLSGVDAEQFTNAIGKLNNNIAEGKLPFKDTNSAIEAFAERIKNAKNGIERAAIATEFFGAKLGKSMIPAALEGKEGLRKLEEQAKSLGLVFSDELVEKADKFKDQIEILGEVFTKNFQSSLLEGFVGKSGEIRDIYTDPKFIESARSLGEAFGAIASAAVELAKVPAILRAIFIELPFTAAKMATNKLLGNEILNNPAVSFNRPTTVDTATFLPKQNADNEAAFEFTKKRSELIKSINADLQKQADLQKLQNNYFGESDALIERQVEEQQILSKLKEAGVVLSEKEKEAIERKLDALQQEKELNKELSDAEKERQKQADEAAKLEEENRKRLEDSVQTVREDLARSLTDAIFNANSLGDSFRNIAKRIAESVVQAELLKAITSATGGSSATSGGGFFGSIFGLLGKIGSFDVGSNYVPYDQLAVVHKGEKIIPAGKVEEQMGVTMNIYTPDANSFRASSRQISRQIKNNVAMA